MDQPILMILFFGGILILAGAVFVLITFVKYGHKTLAVEKYRSRWLEIESSLRREEKTTHSLCILHADSLLDKALRERGVKGATMAERMKQMQGTWTNGNGIWAAHKLRNRIAHEPETVSLDYDRARQILGTYRQALKDVGAI